MAEDQRVKRPRVVSFVSSIWRVVRLLSKKLTQPIRMARDKANGLRGSSLVTPFSPFVLSDYYISEEIDVLGLSYLNPKAKRIDKESLPQLNSVVYCQVDQLQEFASVVLDGLDVPIVLITGKWHLPGLSNSDLVREISSHPMILRWFSQNQIFDDLSIEPFPYGVNFYTSHLVLDKIKRKQKSRGATLLVPYVTIHSHLSPSVRKIRESLVGAMRPKLPVRKYLSSISKAKYVVSPPGDRFDTYRHWECVALGAIPVCVEVPSFKRLFGDTMLTVDDISDYDAYRFSNNRATPDSRRAFLQFWKEEVFSVVQRLP